MVSGAITPSDGIVRINTRREEHDDWIAIWRGAHDRLRLTEVATFRGINLREYLDQGFHARRESITQRDESRWGEVKPFI